MCLEPYVGVGKAGAAWIDSIDRSDPPVDVLWILFCEGVLFLFSHDFLRRQPLQFLHLLGLRPLFFCAVMGRLIMM
jgi:hypothetical protein